MLNETFFCDFQNTVAESSATEKHNCVIKKSGSSRKSRASRKFSMFSSWKAFMNAFAKGQNEWRRRPFCWPSYDVIKHMCSIIISINRVKENCVKSFESFILVRNRGFEPHRGKLFFVTRSFGPQWTSVILRQWLASQISRVRTPPSYGKFLKKNAAKFIFAPLKIIWNYFCLIFQDWKFFSTDFTL